MERKYRLTKNASRRTRRHNLKAKWGYAGGRHNYSKIRESEAEAQEILAAEGFRNIHLLTDVYRHSPFDLRANGPDGRPYVVDVTMNLHHKVLQKYEYASLLGFSLAILFLSPDFKKYLIAYVTGPKKYVILDSEKLIKEVTA